MRSVRVFATRACLSALSHGAGEVGSILKIVLGIPRNPHSVMRGPHGLLLICSPIS